MQVLLELARLSYGLVVMASTVLGALVGFHALTAAFAHFGALAITLGAAALLFLSGGAIARRLRGVPLVPSPSGHGEWACVFFMSCAGLLGHFLAWNVCLAIYQYLYVYPDREREGGPLAFVALIAAACYLLALLIGEFGIRHDQRLLQPRINPSSGRTDALSGNTLESSAPDDTPR
jgi:hypothetical protein